MPANLTLRTLPEPDDDDVKLVTVPAETYAVLRFTGSIAPKAIAEQKQALLARLSSSDWRPDGEPVAWFYDPPWTLPFLRRNEVAVPVRPR
jgi:predicted transcriptional regulator YdeE